MKPRPNTFLRRSTLAAIALAAQSTSSLASNGWWNNVGTGNWSSTANWDTSINSVTTVGAIPSGQTVYFNADRGNGVASTIYLDGARTATSFTVGNTSTTTLLGGISGTPSNNTLTLTSGVTVNSGAGAVTIGDTAGSPTAKVDVLLNNNLSFTNNSSSLLTFANGVSALGAARTLTLAGTGSITLGGALADAGVGQALGIITNNTGTITLSGANSYTGPTSLNGNGTLVLSSDSAFGSGGTVTVQNSRTPILQASGGTRSISNALTVIGSLTLSGSNGFTFSNALTIGNTNPSLTNSTSSGLVTLGNVFLSDAAGTGRAMTIAGTGNTTVGGVIANFNGSGLAGSITISNTGTTTLDVANTFTGNATHSAASGSLVLKNQNALQYAAYNKTGAASLVFDSSVVANAFTFGSLAGSQSLSLQNNAGIPAAIALTAGANNTSTTYSGAISGSGSLVKTGSGALTLSSGSSTYGGGTTLSQGTILLGAGSTTSGTSITSGPLGTGSLTLADGVTLASTSSTSRVVALTGITLNGNITLNQTATGTGRLQIAGPWDLGGGSRTIDIQKTTAIIASGNEGLGFNQPTGFNAPSVGNGSLTLKSTPAVSGIPAQVRFNTTTFTGNAALTVDDGVVLTAQNTNFFAPGTGAPALTLNANATKGGGILQLGDGINVTAAIMRSAEVYSLAGGGTVSSSNTTGTATTGTLTINNGNGADFSGTITETGGTGIIAVAKTGAGTQTLSGANDYSAGTTITGGTLLVNNTTGSGTGSGTVTVNSSGTLGGTGTVAGAVTAAGTIAPGSTGIGTLTVNNSVALTGTYACGVNASASDVLALTGVGGNLNITGATLVISGTPTLASYTIATYTGSLTGSFTGTLPSGYSLDYATTGQIKLVGSGPASNYASWASANGVTGGPSGDSDNDGVKNLVEYALVDGGERGVYSGSTITFTKRGAPYGTDITYTIQVSTDLGIADSWEPAPSGVTESASAISYTFTPSTPVRNFARLKVSQN